MSFTAANYPGWCPECGGPIRKGEMLSGSKETGWKHEDCDEAAYLHESVDGPRFTERELEIIRGIDNGWSRREIADHLDISVTTVRQIVRVLCERFQCRMKDLPRKLETGERA